MVSAVIQWVGPGLIVTEHSSLPSTTTATPQGFATTTITSIETTSYDLALIPLVIVGIVGFVLAMMPKRDETPPNETR